MTQKIKNAYDALFMDEACIQAIETAMARRVSVRNRRTFLRYALATCLALIVLLSLSNTSAVAKAVNYVQKQLRDLATEAGLIDAHSVYTTDGMTLVSGTDVHGKNTAGAYDGSVPDWLEERDGHLYFVGGGAELDISNSFSNDEPFIYTLETPKNIRYIAVGGTYTPDTQLDGVCWAVVVRKVLEDPEPLEGWITAYARDRTLPGTDEFAPWYLKAMDIFEYPILH